MCCPLFPLPPAGSYGWGRLFKQFLICSELDLKAYNDNLSNSVKVIILRIVSGI